MRWKVDRDWLLELLHTELPKTLTHKRVTDIVRKELEASRALHEYRTHEHLAKVTGMNNPRHFSLGRALFEIFLSDLLNDRPLSTSIVVGKSLEPGPGFGKNARICRLVNSEEDWRRLWIRSLRDLGYRALPDGAAIPECAEEAEGGPAIDTLAGQALADDTPLDEDLRALVVLQARVISKLLGR